MKSDEILRRAQQVRAHRSGTVHKLNRATTVPDIGRVYWTACGLILPAGTDASLSTWPVTCAGRCKLWVHRERRGG